MLWVQASVSFLFWLLPGLLFWRRSSRLKQWLADLPRGVRVFLGSAGLLLGMCILIVGLLLVAQNNGLQEGALAPWAWLVITLLGMIFVTIQALGALSMITLMSRPETKIESKASEDSPEKPIS